MKARPLAASAILTLAISMGGPGVPFARAEDSAEEIRLLKEQVQALTRRLSELERRQNQNEAAATTTTTTTPSPAPDAAPSLSIEQQVKVLERKRELDEEAAAEKARTAPVVSLGPTGFSVRSADTNFVLKLRGYVQADVRSYPSDRVDTSARDTFLMRRVRPILEGTVYDRFDYRLMLDFASQAQLSTANNGLVQDAYVTARLAPEFQIAAGKMKEPVGLERLQVGRNLLFIERSYPTQLVPNRDVGFMVQGDLFDGTLGYQAGIFNGTADGGSDDYDFNDNEKDFAGRLFAQPFRNSDQRALRGIGLGVAGTVGNREGAPRSYVSGGLQRFFTYRSSTTGGPNVLNDGSQWRVSPQGWWYWGPFGLFGEFVISNQEFVQAGSGLGAGSRARLENTAWQVAASYFLTGEDNSFTAVAPREPFRLKDRGWGALELAARVGQINLDDDSFPVFASPTTSASAAISYAAGLNWHLNRNVKLSFNYEHTDFDAPADNPYSSHDEDVVLGRVQFGW